MEIRHGGVYALTIYDVLRRSRGGLTSASICESVVSRTGMSLSVRKVREYLRTLDFVGATGAGFRVTRERAGTSSQSPYRYRLIESVGP